VRNLTSKHCHLAHVKITEADLKDPHTYDSDFPFDSVICSNFLEHLD